MNAETSWSAAPDRTSPRTSRFPEAKRHVKSLPSADSRARLQSVQKGSVTELTIPISPRPSM